MHQQRVTKVTTVHGIKSKVKYVAEAYYYSRPTVLTEHRIQKRHPRDAFDPLIVFSDVQRSLNITTDGDGCK